MYYNRTLSNEFAAYLEPGGPLRWLFEFVKQNKELDFQIGRNKVNPCLVRKMSANEWISVYHGLTCILKIRPSKIPNTLRIDAAGKYRALSNIYGKRNINDNFQEDILKLIQLIHEDKELNRFFISEKEGYFQNLFSRRYGILGKVEDDFVIIDKEVVAGYKNKLEKEAILGTLQLEYRGLHRSIPESSRYSRRKSLGNELDFLALDKNGHILLIEFKHGSSTSGIYKSPFQIGLYNDIFNKLQLNDFKSAIYEMLLQKQRIGLINSEWRKPELSGKIVPWLVIAEYNEKCCAKDKFPEIMQITRNHFGLEFLRELKVMNYIPEDNLTEFNFNFI